MQASLGCALVGLQFLNTTIGFALTVTGIGVSSGAFSLLTAAAWPKREHLGSINGFVSAWMVGASALGPYLLSQGKAMTSDYSFVLAALLSLPLALFVAAFFAQKPTDLKATNAKTKARETVT